MSFTPDPRHSERPPVGAGIAAAAVTGILASIVGFIAVAVTVGATTATSGSAGPTFAGALLRTIFTGAVVLGVVFLASMLTGRGSPWWWAGIAALGQLLDLWAWGGNALFTTVLLTGGSVDQDLVVRVIGFVVDLALWVGIAHVGARLGLATGLRRREGVGRLS